MYSRSFTIIYNDAIYLYGIHEITVLHTQTDGHARRDTIYLYGTNSNEIPPLGMNSIVHYRSH